MRSSGGRLLSLSFCFTICSALVQTMEECAENLMAPGSGVGIGAGVGVGVCVDVRVGVGSTAAWISVSVGACT